MAMDDASSSPLLRASSRPPPRITYGRQTNRPLSLTATQFRRDTRVTTIDNGEGWHTSDLAATAVPTEDDDSGGSDSEQEPPNAFHTNGRQNAHRASRPRATNGSSRPLRQAISSSPRTPEPVSRRKKRSTRKAKPELKSASVKKTKTGIRTAAPSVRRLPIDELILVASSPKTSSQESFESGYDDRQDPITDHSGTPSARGSPERTTRRPLSTLRNRLKTSTKRKTTLVCDRPQPSAPNWNVAIESRDQRGGDGFERSELVITKRATRSKTPAKRTASFIQGFSALQLGSGPLPDVVFEASTMELDVEAGGYDTGNIGLGDDQYEPNLSPPPDSNQSQKLRDLEMERETERLIRAQLASISAPARPPSESSESEVDSDEGSDVENDDADPGKRDDGNGSASTDETSDQHSPDAFTCPPPYQRPERTDENRHSYSLSFQHNRTPGQLPRKSLGKRKLVEVNEAIVQVSESALTPESYLAVNMRPSDKPTTFQRPHSPLMQYPQRLRSILKNSSLATPSNTHHSGLTKANTRWNSRPEASDESPYFTTATEELRRGSRPRRRSSYFVDQNVQILDSDRIVPETSPSRFEYRPRGRADLVTVR
ncbi:hypothetical protein BDY17DRAFT_23815 [Neohortaea acidophila]|uniref:Uncharacterized protein n=1 Tax=Neohortaea acidophila TaxID=245834 RepID=A0A6A6Q723_9PEZI|nr:uncharacterized protein BDY17DRAFT_23815 [Neohortaea acidophila]KAF2488105.1 hypothetical protein BDY17DRAFT_23815 [Neohortaea acidophila]